MTSTAGYSLYPPKCPSPSTPGLPIAPRQRVAFCRPLFVRNRTSLCIKTLWPKKIVLHLDRTAAGIQVQTGGVGGAVANYTLQDHTVSWAIPIPPGSLWPLKLDHAKSWRKRAFHASRIFRASARICKTMCCLARPMRSTDLTSPDLAVSVNQFRRNATSPLATLGVGY